MRVGIDLSITRINQAGSSIYAASLLAALQSRHDRNSYLTFAVNQNRDMANTKTLASRMQTIYRDIIWTHLQLPRYARQAHVDLLHMPTNILPLFSRIPTALTVLDTTILQTPENFTRWHRTYARIVMPLSVKQAVVILTISEQSKRDIGTYFSVAEDKVYVTYLAASERFRPVSARALSEIKEKYNLQAFILTVGTLEPRKNIPRLLQAFKLVRDTGRPIELVHAGPKGWRFDDIAAEVKRLGLTESVRFLGRVPLEDLVKLYNAAAAFAYPSTYEGFGLPPLEAMACACPVITSKVSSIPEVVGQAAMMVDPYDVQQLADALCQVLEDTRLADRLRQSGQAQARLFSWRRCAEATVRAYEACLKRS